MLQAEQEAVARLKKSQAEVQKQAQSLEVSLGEMQEKCSQLENSKMELEKQLRGLQAELEEERRGRNMGTETINDLQGETWLSITPWQQEVLTDLKQGYEFCLDSLDGSQL